ncbi:hypothetical protein C450_04968 [Halococcus salifodinae DSM 8989]|uniref:Uncharacterized protein n=2 Tax=Halococcus salifodinae TaxID=36738 RepID=M0NA73_9EURY|nr:hypothetical protein C450_04968 [Halococcus salifodinae DSM 8989]
MVSEMTAVLTRFHARQKYRHLSAWAFGRAFFAYAFAQTYLYLYGPAPAVVPRLGMTVAALCGAVAVLFGAAVLVLWLTDWVERMRQQWLPRLIGARTGGE